MGTTRPGSGHGFELAVLVNAIRRLTDPTGVFRHREDAIARARGWVAASDTSWPFAFHNVCQGLGVDPGRLRLRLLNGVDGRGKRGTERPLESELVSMVRAGEPLAVVAKRLAVDVPPASSLSERLARPCARQRRAR